jgi:Flp pilus assembly secretin CpaC
LQIRPQVEKGDSVSAMIQVSISDLDYANSVKLEGYDVPALLNRSANSKINVEDGGTVVIAGL